MADYPITPPPELVQQWLCSDDFLWGPLEQTSMTITTNRLQNVAAQAAQWGANQCAAVNEAELQKARDEELKACLWHLGSTRCNQIVITTLRAARRPKPPSLKEQALASLAELESPGRCDEPGYESLCNIIRQALEALPDD